MDDVQILVDRYSLGQLLGRGGMADVYLGHDARLGRTVAVKVLRTALAGDPRFLARFKREAQSIAALSHPNIVSVYDTGAHTFHDGIKEDVSVPFMVMEYVEGDTLQDYIHNKPLNIEKSLEYTREIVSALEYSHSQGIIHRDIKPANVIITNDNSTVKVMDFGIARTISQSTVAMTQTQAIMGTAYYLSPEQARGELVDGKSDLYSVSALLYELLTGRPPFLADNPVSVAFQHVSETPQLPSSFNPDIPPLVDALVMKGLNKDPQDRYDDASDFLKEIQKTQVALNPHSKNVTPVDLGSAEETKTSDQQKETQDLSADKTDDVYTPQRFAPENDTTVASSTQPTSTQSAPSTSTHSTQTTKKVQETKKKKRWPAVLGTFLILALIAGICGFFWYQNYQTVHIPHLANMSVDEASSTLKKLDLKVTTKDEYSDTVPSSDVISSDPNSQTAISRNSTVTLYVSKGPQEIEIPKNLVGKTEKEARKALKKADLNVGNISYENNSAAKGTVIKTNPEPGKKTGKGKKVNLVLSTGKIKVPSVVGQYSAPARQQLESAGLVVITRVQSTANATAGTVIAQSLAPASDVEPKTQIVLTIAVEMPQPLPEQTTPQDKQTNTDDEENKNVTPSEAEESESATPKTSTPQQSQSNLPEETTPKSSAANEEAPKSSKK